MLCTHAHTCIFIYLIFKMSVVTFEPYHLRLAAELHWRQAARVLQHGMRRPRPAQELHRHARPRPDLPWLFWQTLKKSGKCVATSTMIFWEFVLVLHYIFYPDSLWIFCKCAMMIKFLTSIQNFWFCILYPVDIYPMIFIYPIWDICIQVGSYCSIWGLTLLLY